ncbi:BON domain-containing protein [Dyella solisilvae]|uniref:BON domain-containing protein n=1 Tax=Dyella solisilvae TaxID=1920168 RepID=A0A370KC50_9GAMM|nr:BON domain-containing protein [Dyella solisilvae]RDJ00229.1 BON domain-containing protein [Dyella solisilvae]
MRNQHLIRKTLIAAGLVAVFAATPFAQVAAQDAAMQKQGDNQTVPDKTADAWITTKVKSELATTKGIKSTDISVATMDGVVSLTGTATSATEKTKAEHVAMKVKGVKSVDSRGLTVSDTAK